MGVGENGGAKLVVKPSNASRGDQELPMVAVQQMGF